MSTSNRTSISKRCKQCGEIKPLDEFYKDRSLKDGHRNDCKLCNGVRRSAHAAAHKEERRLYNAKYGKDHRKEITQQKAKYRAEHQEKVQAQYLANREVSLARTRRNYAKNREQRLAYNNQYYAANREKILAQKAVYWASRRSDKAKYDANYRVKKPHVVKANELRRRARKRNLPAQFTAQDEMRMFEYFQYRCVACGRTAGLWHTIARDHWIPLVSADCPGTVPTNMVPLCHSTKGGEGSCNNSKSHHNPHEWLVSKFGKRKAAKIEARIQAYFDSLKENN